MSLSLLEVVAAVRARRASLSAETVGYLLLGVADHVLAVPRELGASDVLLGEEGAVMVGVGKTAAPERSERALRELLDALLSVASTATPALLRIGRRQATTGVDALVRELESALIPVNRAAARRALTRLYRDTQRAVQSGPLDVAAAQGWLERAAAPSAPAPVVVSPPSPVALEPVPVALPPSEVPVEIFEPSLPAPIAITRPPPAIEERPLVESLTCPEPVVVRAAARARFDFREREIEQAPLPFEGTPRLGTFASAAVLPPLSVSGNDALLLTADEATDRMPEVIPEPVVELVKTAPLYDVVTVEAASVEHSADFASIVTDLVTQSEDPASPAAPAVAEPAAPAVAVSEAPAVLESTQAPEPEPEPVAEALDGDFVLEDEIVIVVDEDLEAFEPEASQASDEDYPVTRWWSSPEPPALTVSDAVEQEQPLEPEEPAVESIAVAELPSVPELELPPLPEFVAWPITPEPPVQVASGSPAEGRRPLTWPAEEPASAVTEEEPKPETDFEHWGPEADDDAYLDLWEAASSDEAWEPEPDDLSDVVEAEPEALDEADFEAAAAGYAPLEAVGAVESEPAMPVAQPVQAEPRVLTLSEAVDYSEVGWTPAPEPQPEPLPEPSPEPAPPRFAPRRSDVGELLRGFAVTEARSDRELCRDLKALAGVDLTPPPPGSGALR